MAYIFTDLKESQKLRLNKYMILFCDINKNRNWWIWTKCGWVIKKLIDTNFKIDLSIDLLVISRSRPS